MNICIFNRSSNKKLHVMWCDKVYITPDNHLYGGRNNSRVFESTSVIAMSLQQSGIVLNTKSGSSYIISTPGKQAMKKLFKQLVAQVC